MKINLRKDLLISVKRGIIVMKQASFLLTMFLYLYITSLPIVSITFHYFSFPLGI